LVKRRAGGHGIRFIVSLWILQSSTLREKELSVDSLVEAAIGGLSIFCLPNFGYRAIGTALKRTSLSKSIAITIREVMFSVF